jgi:alkylated DNA repair dioxygenase AlkB
MASENQPFLYLPEFLPPELGSIERILAEVDFMSPEESAILLYGKRVHIPRQQVAYGDTNTVPYRFSGTAAQPRAWPPVLKGISDFLNESYLIREKGLMHLSNNFVLVNYYRDGASYLGYHSDDETDLVSNTPIISISLGGSRDFHLKNIETGEVTKFKLQDRDGLIMFGDCQSRYKHAVPKRAHAQPRLNLTFRTMRTIISKMS